MWSSVSGGGGTATHKGIILCDDFDDENESVERHETPQEGDVTKKNISKQKKKCLAHFFLFLFLGFH